MKSILCIGNIVADVVARPVHAMPDKGKLNLVDNIELHSGGCAANSACALGKLGNKVGIIGAVGNDQFGDFIHKKLKEHNVDTTSLKRDRTLNTSATMVMVSEDGERSFLHYLGANTKLTLKDINLKKLEQYDILFISGFYIMPGLDGKPTTKLLKIAKRKNITTVLDVCWDAKGRWLSLIKNSLPYIDYFMPSYDEARMISGLVNPSDIADFFINQGVKACVIKLGKKGCLVRTKNEEHMIPAYNVKAVDATGAGDSFVAGFLTGLVKGWDLKRCGTFGNAVGASCVTAMGATTGIKSFDETVKFAKIKNL